MVSLGLKIEKLTENIMKMLFLNDINLFLKAMGHVLNSATV